MARSSFFFAIFAISFACSSSIISRSRLSSCITKLLLSHGGAYMRFSKKLSGEQFKNFIDPALSSNRTYQSFVLQFCLPLSRDHLVLVLLCLLPTLLLHLSLPRKACEIFTFENSQLSEAPAWIPLSVPPNIDLPLIRPGSPPIAVSFLHKTWQCKADQHFRGVSLGLLDCGTRRRTAIGQHELSTRLFTIGGGSPPPPTINTNVKLIPTYIPHILI